MQTPHFERGGAFAFADGTKGPWPTLPGRSRLGGMRGSLRSFIAFLATACLALPAWALPEKMTDKEDGAFDLSDYLLLHRGALPVPIIITEPAVGYGGGIAIAYFSQSFAEQAEKARAAGETVIPPDIAVGGAFKRENGSLERSAGYLGF